MDRVFVCLHHEPVVLPFLSSSFHFKSLVHNSELVRRDTRSDEREREERSGKKNKGFGRDGEVWETFGDYSTFLEKRYRLTKELASEYISFAFVSFHKVECKKRGVQVGNARAATSPLTALIRFCFDFDLRAVSLPHQIGSLMSLAGLGHYRHSAPERNYHVLLVCAVVSVCCHLSIILFLLFIAKSFTYLVMM